LRPREERKNALERSMGRMDTGPSGDLHARSALRSECLSVLERQVEVCFCPNYPARKRCEVAHRRQLLFDMCRVVIALWAPDLGTKWSWTLQTREREQTAGN